uniref:Uncharacterized protein n=1 Tax=Setaria viridis TaxID=4556 RepID=A0A4U6TD07_SETVI|nr:hypothetical protein SEVIR_8G079500v2 [Setaria viridis]
MYAFHKWHMEAAADGRIRFAAQVQDRDYFQRPDDIWIEFESLWYLYHQDTLDKSLISAWVLMKIGENISITSVSWTTYNQEFNDHISAVGFHLPSTLQFFHPMRPIEAPYVVLACRAAVPGASRDTRRRRSAGSRPSAQAIAD